jgi:hypothetical protein
VSMSATANPDRPIIGYADIAKAVTRAIGASVSTRTAKRYAEQGRTNRLPVLVYPNGRAYLLPADLAVWARAWLAHRPSGAREPGKRPPKQAA